MKLDLVELLYLHDNLTLEVDIDNFLGSGAFRSTIPTAVIMCPLSMLMKIGKGILDATATPPIEVNIQFTEDELLIIRELAVTNFKTPSKEYGKELKIKAYKELLAIDQIDSDIALSMGMEEFLGRAISNDDTSNTDTY